MGPHLDVAVGAVENVERDAAATELLQIRADLGVLICPIALQKGDMQIRESLSDLRPLERKAIVDFARDAPCRGNVDEYGMSSAT